MGAMSQYLEDAHEDEQFPCPCCVAKELSTDMQTLLLSEMYAASKGETKEELFKRIYSSGMLYTALGHLYRTLLVEANELFEEDFNTSK